MKFAARFILTFLLTVAVMCAWVAFCHPSLPFTP